MTVANADVQQTEDLIYANYLATNPSYTNSRNK